MPVVSNTSPLLNLAIIDYLHLLPHQFDEVLIPPTVFVELKPATEYPGVVRIEQALDARWLRITELQDTRLAQALMLELDRGEAAAIALALELGLARILSMNAMVEPRQKHSVCNLSVSSACCYGPNLRVRLLPWQRSCKP